MKYSDFPENLFATIAASVFLTGIHSQSWADDDTATKPLKLHKIMQELGNNIYRPSPMAFLMRTE